MWEQIKKIFSANEPLVITEEYLQILKSFEEGENLFITGRAGTGKSRLIEYLKSNTNKNVVVLAPTGLAALNIKGQTIHSFFKLPPRLLTKEVVARIKLQTAMLSKIEAIVIDEASMVRADVLDAVDQILRRGGKDIHLPFGGIQIVLVGDLFQLPPVVNSEEVEAFKTIYDIPYFFGAAAFAQAEFKIVRLTKMFRQTDEDFINILNKVRDGETEQVHLDKINTRSGKKLDTSKFILLASTNRIVNEINLAELDRLSGKERLYNAEFEGDFHHDDRALPVEPELRLKKGARVVILKNGPAWVNGSMGEVVQMGEYTVTIHLDDGPEVEIGVEEWTNIKYEIKDRRVEEKKMGTMRQIPVRLAWAVTIHKSQGMTFDRVYIDLTRSPFAHGQTYVALSRCRTLEGLVLSRPLYSKDIIVDPEIVKFSSRS